MAQHDPFALPPGPVRQYVSRAMQIATKRQASADYDIAPDVEAFGRDIKEQADVLKPAGDGPRFLAAVRSQLKMMEASEHGPRGDVFRVIGERLV